jgi:phage recombination protein Bet
MSTENQAVATIQKVSLIETMAHEYGMEASPFLEAIKQTVMPGGATNAQIAAFLQVAHEYGLNPFIREIYAFPAKGGGIQPVVSVDGWIAKITNHPEFEGMEPPVFEMNKEKIVSCTITAYRKGWKSPIIVTEWFEECYRNTEPWNKMPHRMLRNRTMCQLGRMGFGIKGIMLPDEAEEIDITAESTVMERTTATKTEALKEKIGAKKAEAQKPQAPKVEVKQEPEVPPEQAPPPTIDYEERLSNLHNGVNNLFGIEESEPDRLLTDEERKTILSLLKAKSITPEIEAKISKAARQKFMEFGAASTKQLKLSALQVITEWAENLAV